VASGIVSTFFSGTAATYRVNGVYSTDSFFFTDGLSKPPDATADARHQQWSETMSSFSCPHYDVRDDWCRRVNGVCVPGRPGCTLQHNSKFVVPVDERIRRKEEQRAQRRRETP